MKNPISKGNLHKSIPRIQWVKSIKWEAGDNYMQKASSYFSYTHKSSQNQGGVWFNQGAHHPVNNPTPKNFAPPSHFVQCRRNGCKVTNLPEIAPFNLFL